MLSFICAYDLLMSLSVRWIFHTVEHLFSLDESCKDCKEPGNNKQIKPSKYIMQYTTTNTIQNTITKIQYKI